MWFFLAQHDACGMVTTVSTRLCRLLFCVLGVALQLYIIHFAFWRCATVRYMQSCCDAAEQLIHMACMFAHV